jgi:YegS/Rv2252/BmrU family lipid kinase
MYPKNVHFIVNPVSGGGRTSKIFTKLLPDIRKLFGENYQVHITKQPGDATSYAREISGPADDLIVAVGGDGTVQEVVNGIFNGRSSPARTCELGIINTGTGRGLIKSLNLPTSPVEQLRQVVRLPGRKVDIGSITYRDGCNESRARYFLNECQAGIGGTVVKGVSTNHKLLGGTLAFGSVAATQAIGYKARDFRVWTDGTKVECSRLIGIVIGNGAHCAGGMQLTPNARPNDGILDVLLIHDMNPFRRLLNFSRIYSGNHIRSKYFTCQCCRKIRVDAAEPVLVEADGELLGTVPFTIEVLPARIRIRCNI